MLSLRALTPDGYMPGSKGSGLLFELCPSGMPAVIMQSLAGEHHHHHGGHGDDSPTVSGTEQCPIGHMLASAVAVDCASSTAILPGGSSPDATIVAIPFRATPAVYRSRAPPA